MKYAVVDIDDTLLYTKTRNHAVWRHVMGREIPFEDVITMGAKQIFDKHATPEEMDRMDELQDRYWGVLLCREEPGPELLEMDEAIPHAAEALQRWSEHSGIVYLTGRPETMRGPTLDALRRFGFPTNGVQLVMYDLSDWDSFLTDNSRALFEARRRLFTSIAERHTVTRVVDDFPGYFRIYSELDIRDRVGLHRSSRHTRQMFFDRGATRVVESWQPLVDDLQEV